MTMAVPGAFDGTHVGAKIGASFADRDFLVNQRDSVFADFDRFRGGGTEATFTGGAFAGFGYTIGAGVEVPSMEDVFVRGDHAFTDLGTRRILIEDVNGADRVEAEFDTEVHDVRIGVGHRF